MIIQRNSKLDLTNIPDALLIDVALFRVKYEGLVEMNEGHIVSDDGIVEALGRINLAHRGFAAESGLGAGHSNDFRGYGASHGGDGGVDRDNVLDLIRTYNSLYNPTHRGSGGGNGDGQGGAGGSYLQWYNQADLRIDGLLQLEGQDGQSGNAGGGSGGALLIDTLHFNGFGFIHCEGGDGSGSSGGGGGGGRIAIWIRHTKSWNGYMYTQGGQGTTNTIGGAAGTIYLEESNRGPQYADIKYGTDGVELRTAQHKRIEVDNHDLDADVYADHTEPWVYTSLYEESHDSYEFDEALMHRHANVRIDYPDEDDSNAVNVTIHLFEGDRTGLLHLRANQKLWVEVVESQSNETIAPCSYRVDDGAEIFLPTETNLLGTRTLLAGQITGVQTMIVTGGADVVFQGTATTAMMANNAYVEVTEPGNFSFVDFIVERYSASEFENIVGELTLTVNYLNTKFGGELFFNDAHILSRVGIVESGGVLHLDGTGSGSGEGHGAGQTVGSVGTGGGHGGFGGAADPEANGGRTYDSVYNPRMHGSGGGADGSGNPGGAGGGLLDWRVADLMEIDGVLALKGKDAESGHAGGGSGGALYVEAETVTGHGVVSVHGGKGVNQGGGGAGGRVAIKCRMGFFFGGKFDNYGGLGGSGYESDRAGASGTTYVTESFRPLEYRFKKFDPYLNYTLITADHTYLHTDNDGASSPAYTVIEEEIPSELLEEGESGIVPVYEFDEMDLTDTARLRFFHGDTSITATVHRFIGDRTGILHIYEDQTVFVEVNRTETNRTEAPCSYIIDEHGTIVFPQEVHLHGTSTRFAGLMIGAENLYVEGGAEVDFHSSGMTSLFTNNSFYFSALEVMFIS